MFDLRRGFSLVSWSSARFAGRHRESMSYCKKQTSIRLQEITLMPQTFTRAWLISLPVLPNYGPTEESWSTSLDAPMML